MNNDGSTHPWPRVSMECPDPPELPNKYIYIYIYIHIQVHVCLHFAHRLGPTGFGEHSFNAQVPHPCLLGQGRLLIVSDPGQCVQEKREDSLVGGYIVLFSLGGGGTGLEGWYTL